MKRTLLPRVNGEAVSAALSGLLAVGAVALVAYGISMIFVPAGVIAAGLGLVALQWQFFGSQ